MESVNGRLQKEINRNKVLTSKCIKLEQDKGTLRASLEVLDGEKDMLEAKVDEMKR